MKKFVMITSIFAPTEAVNGFSKMPGFQLVVVGDKKTPDGWACENVEYISIARQQQIGRQLRLVLPYNHYCRKMMGYLHVIKQGADFIVDTDDDNIPKSGWGFPGHDGQFDKIAGNLGFVNVYQLFSGQKVWPRGLPLRLINKDFNLESQISQQSCKIGVWQGLADEDPDVDAIYRLTCDTPVYFQERKPVVLSRGTISPFNTQNTMFVRELFPLLYLPTYVTFRFTDILRGLVAQPIMWLYGYELGILGANVVQKRNPHDYMKDFLSEIPMFQHCEKVIELVSDAVSAGKTIEVNLYNAYTALRKADIVCDKEIVTLEAWLQDIAEAKEEGCQ